jgi:uncharacterized protein YcbK (DUF882 family)
MDRPLFLSLLGGMLASPSMARAFPAPPLRRLRLINAHTSESFDGPYRDDTGPIAMALEDLSSLLRDHHTGERIAVDVGVIDFLAALMDAMGATRATVLSGYRTVATNGLLARTNFGVADNSQHLYGRALDILFDTRLEAAMKTARAMKRGGVGWYPRSGFIHIDTGPVRNWTLEDRGLEHLLLPLDQLVAGNGSRLTSPTPVGRLNSLIPARTPSPFTAQQELGLKRIVDQALAQPFTRRISVGKH